jgi:conjugative transfer region protein (TIGR03748 family)
MSRRTAPRCRVCVVLLALCTSLSHAQLTQEMGQSASEVRAGVALAMNPLRLQVQLRLPAEARTVGAAVRYLLEPSGYRLIGAASQDAQVILARPVPARVRSPALVAIDDALLRVAGEDVRLVVDHANRLVTFERM